MSSQNQTTASETSPLLRGSQPAGRSSRHLSGERFAFSPEVLLVPVAFGYKLGSAIPSTTLAELLRQTVCRLSNTLHGHPASLVLHRPRYPQFCDSPQVMRDFATVSAIFGMIGGVVSLLGCGILSRILPHYGRRPVFLFLFIMEITWCCLILGSQFMPGGLTDVVFLVGMLSHTISQHLPYAYLINMYIIDICNPEHRTTMMSKIGGWGVLGTSIPLALGGSITTNTGDPLIVFYIATMIFIGSFIYVISVLPETFSEEQRNALSRMRQESVGDTPKTGRLASFLSIFDPLKVLVPTRTIGGFHNWRLTWCSAHDFMFATAHGYIWSAWFVIVSSKYHLTPSDTGIFWSCVTFTGMITLTVIVPQAVRFLRPYYAQRTPRFPLGDEGLGNNVTFKEETSDHLDVHLAVVACIFAAVVPLVATTSKTTLTLFICAAFTGLSFMHGPTVHSLVSRSVDQLKQGEALAAIHMVNSAGSVLSPIVMGSIFTWTVDSAPLLVFYVHLAVVLVSAGLLLLVRDADRYHDSCEGLSDTPRAPVS